MGTIQLAELDNRKLFCQLTSPTVNGNHIRYKLMYTTAGPNLQIKLQPHRVASLQAKYMVICTKNGRTKLPCI